MNTRRPALIGLLVMLAATPAMAGNVGFDTVHARGPGWSTLSVAIWYPTDAPAAPISIGLVDQTVAFAAPVSGAAHPLIVVSHGNGGSGFGHYDTAIALAEAGFVVAAVTHTGDNYRDHSDETRLADRPPQISAVIDHMLHAWPGHAAIDPARIGMFGFSAGGFTALVSIGGVPDLARIPPYCAAHATAFACTLVRRDVGSAGAVPPASSWHADARIRAAVIAAPGLGFTFTRAGLRGVTVPVQLWAAGDDHVLSVQDDDEAVRDAWPGPVEYHLVRGAGHFDFLGPCSVALAAIAPPICDDAGGFDRRAFHRNFNAAIVRFFQARL